MTGGVDVGALRAAAEGATPGPWIAYQEHGRDYTDEGWSHIAVGTERGNDVAVTHSLGFEGLDEAAENSAFIATANPTAVLALLDALATAGRRLAAVADVSQRFGQSLDMHRHIWTVEDWAAAWETYRDEFRAALGAGEAEGVGRHG